MWKELFSELMARLGVASFCRYWFCRSVCCELKIVLEVVETNSAAEVRCGVLNELLLTYLVYGRTSYLSLGICRSAGCPITLLCEASCRCAAWE